MLLVDRGKLALDDHVKAHMPDAPAAWDTITIFHLLTHTSGIPSVTSLPGYATWKLSATTPGQTLAHFRDLPLEFAPGPRTSYSNSGDIVLGYLIPEAKDRLFLKVVNAQIEFVRGRAGQVQALILHQGGRDARGVRR